MPLCVPAQSLSRVQLFATPRTVARQAPLFMGLPRQENWNGLPLPSPGDQTPISCLAGRFFTTAPPGKPTNALRTPQKPLPFPD